MYRRQIRVPSVVQGSGGLLPGLLSVVNLYHGDGGLGLHGCFPASSTCPSLTTHNLYQSLDPRLLVDTNQMQQLDASIYWLCQEARDAAWGGSRSSSTYNPSAYVLHPQRLTCRRIAC